MPRSAFFAAIVALTATAFAQTTAKLKELGVATKQVVLKDAKHGCWMQRPCFEQCLDATDAWFREYMK